MRLTLLHEAVNRLRAFTPDSQMVIVAAPDAIDAFWKDNMLPMPRRPLDACSRLKLMGIDVIERADAPPGVMYVVDRRYAPSAL